jgi:hypothetical protein
MDSWDGNYMPVSGSVADWEASSFNSKPEDIINWIETEKPSADLKDFLRDYPDAIITDAAHNASMDTTDTDGEAGEFWWNLSFGKKRDQGDDWDEKYRYQVLVYHLKTWDMVALPTPHKEYNDTYRIEWERGPRSGGAGLSPDDIVSQTVTMASSEKVFKTDDVILDNFYTGIGGVQRAELDWGDGEESDTRYTLHSTGGWESIGIDLIATLTGIQMQVGAKYYWQLEKNDLLSGGTWSSASLDAETGRLISITEIESTPLEGAINWGGGD